MTTRAQRSLNRRLVLHASGAVSLNGTRIGTYAVNAPGECWFTPSTQGRALGFNLMGGGGREGLRQRLMARAQHTAPIAKGARNMEPTNGGRNATNG